MGGEGNRPRARGQDVIRYGTRPWREVGPVDPNEATTAVGVQWVELVGKDGQVVRLNVGNFLISGVEGSADNGIARATINLLGPVVPVFCDAEGARLKGVHITDHRANWHHSINGIELCDMYGEKCEWLSDLLSNTDESRVNAREIQEDGVVGLGKTDEFAIEEARRDR